MGVYLERAMRADGRARSTPRRSSCGSNVCVASAVFKDRNLQYVFRPQVHSDQYRRGVLHVRRRERARRSSARRPKDIKVAIIHEDGPYGVGVAAGNEAKCKELGMQIVHKEGYSATATDLSALVTKLRRAQPDVILHTGYNPDITLFLRQAQGSGPEVRGADRPRRRLRPDRQADARPSARTSNYFYNVDPVAAQLLDPKTLKPGVGDLTAEMVKRYKAETGADEVPPHVSMGFNNTWIFLTDVLPRAIKKYGGYDPEALRKAALETDIPVGGTIQGYGVKFFPPGHADGRAERALHRRS